MTDRINHITADAACDSPGPEACFAYQTDSEFFLIVDCARGSTSGGTYLATCLEGLDGRALFCLVLFSLQLSVCLWWHDYRRDDFPTLKFGVVLADLARHLLREEPFALSAAPTIWAGEPGHC